MYAHLKGNVVALTSLFVLAGSYATEKAPVAGQEYEEVELAAADTSSDLDPHAILTLGPLEKLRPIDKHLIGLNNNWFNSEDLIFERNENRISPNYLKVADGLPITLTRMSGTASQHYKWKQLMGPLEQRVPQKQLAGGIPAHKLGPLEWVDSVQSTAPDAEFVWVLNLYQDSIQDHADLVRLLRKGANDEWGKKRIDYGITKPVDVAIWELGNELDWGEHREHFPLETYVETCRQTIAAIRTIDPTAKFSAHAVTAPWSPKAVELPGDWATWHRALLQELGDQLDYIAIHPYYHGLTMAEVEPYLDQISQDILEITGTDRIKIQVSEHALWPPRIPGQKWNETWHQTHGLIGCLATSEFFNRIYQRGDVAAANYHCFNGGPWAVLKRDPETRQHYRTGIYSLLSLYDQAFGSHYIPFELKGEQTDPRNKDLTLTAFASKTENGFNLLITNRHPIQSRAVKTSLPDGYTLSDSTILTAPHLESHNTANQPDVIKLHAVARPESADTLDAPAKSIVLYRFTRQ